MPEVEEVTKYRCPYCKTTFKTREEAIDCMEQGEAPKLEIGDIVVHGHFGWWDGDPGWIANQEHLGVRENGDVYRKGRPRPCPDTGSSNCFRPCCCLQFYYVVVGVSDTASRNAHEYTHSLVTDAMGGLVGHREHKTGARYMKKIDDPPPHIIERAKEIIKEWNESREDD